MKHFIAKIFFSLFQHKQSRKTKHIQIIQNQLSQESNLKSKIKGMKFLSLVKTPRKIT